MKLAGFSGFSRQVVTLHVLLNLCLLLKTDPHHSIYHLDLVVGLMLRGPEGFLIWRWGVN